MSIANEGEDFYYTPDGWLVMTEQYHIRRGYCCGKGCRHCPYNFEKVPEPRRTALLSDRHATQQSIKKDLP